MELKKLIDEHKVISFDIFDTLIERNVEQPVDAFVMIENIYNNGVGEISNFQIDRINAEKKARRSCKDEEITLQNIYNELKDKYSDAILKKLIDIEINVELSLCQEKKDISKYFNYAKELGKNVIITSDMYLPHDTIEKILNYNGIQGYSYLYLSSDIKKTKHTGNLFRYIKEKLSVNYNDILHIGDNIFSDIKQANLLGIDTYHISECKTGEISNKILNKLRLKFSKKDFEKNLLNTFIDKNFENDIQQIRNLELYKFGYTILGPVLYGFLNNIEKKCIQMNLEHIYFFSRDGYLLKEAYDKYYKSNYNISSSYLYVSRKALVTPMLEKEYSIKNIKDLLGIKGTISVDSFLKRLSNNVDKYGEFLHNHKLSLDDTINFNSDYSKIDSFYLEIRNKLFDEIYQQRELLKRYLIQEGFNKYEKVGIMDLGWRGSLQYAMKKIIDSNHYNVNTYGFYIGLTDEYNEYKENGMDAEGYIFMPQDIELENRIVGAKGLVELLFSAPHGSTLGYKIVRNNIQPILDEMDYDKYQQKKIDEIQLGALNFVKDFSNKFYNLDLNLSKDILINRLIRYISNPTIKEVSVFKEFKFNDFGRTDLINAKEIKSYLFNPRRLLNDFGESRWKIGFMKMLFKIKFNYFMVYCLLKKIFNR